MTLVRKDTARGHTYTLDGRAVKGVTTLINGGLPKPALTSWAARTVAEYVADNPDAVRAMLDTLGREAIVGALKATPWDKRDEAAARGTEIHALAEQVIHGQAVDVPERLLGYVDGYVRWLDSWGVEPILTERPCASREWWYAGTFDAVARITRGQYAGATALLDWKTSKAVYGDNALQLSAYAHSEFYLSESEEPMPQVDLLGVAHVTPTGTDLYVVTDPEAAWRCFQHVSWLAKRTDDIKGFLPESTPAPEAVPA